MRTTFGALSFVLLGLAAGVPSSAKPLDPGLAQSLTYGSPPSPAATDRVRRDRSGLSRFALPTHPAVEWQAQVGAGIAAAPLVDPSGTSIVLSPNGSVTALDRQGRSTWSSLLDSPPLCSGVLTNRSQAVFVSRSGHVTGLNGAGARDYDLFVGQPLRRTSAAPLPHPNDGAVVNLDSQIYWIDASGEVVAQVEAAEPPSLLLMDAHHDLVVLGAGGAVFRWRFSGPITQIADLGGRSPRSAAIFRNDLYAVLTNGRWVTLDLNSGETLRNIELPTAAKTAVLTLTPSGESRLIGDDGVLVSYSVEGDENPGMALATPEIEAARARGTRFDFLPAIADEAGTLAFSAPGLPVAVLLPDGSARETPDAACSTPEGLVPAGAQRLLLACSSGIIWSISQASRAAP